MLPFVKKLIKDKKEYRIQMKRIEQLPEDYRFVLQKMLNYMWGFAGGDGFDMLKTQYDLIELFEAAAARGEHVLSVTGTDVAGFCDALIKDNRLWLDQKRKKLNQEIASL